MGSDLVLSCDFSYPVSIGARRFGIVYNTRSFFHRRIAAAMSPEMPSDDDAKRPEVCSCSNGDRGSLLTSHDSMFRDSLSVG